MEILFGIIAIIVAIVHYLVDEWIFNHIKSKSNLKYWIFSIIVVIVIEIIVYISFYLSSDISIAITGFASLLGAVTILTLIRLVSKIKNNVLKKSLKVVLFIAYILLYIIVFLSLSFAYKAFIPNNFLFEVSGRTGDNRVYVYKNGTVIMVKPIHGFGEINTQKKGKLKGNYDLVEIKKNLKQAASKYNSQEVKDDIKDFKELEKRSLAKQGKSEYYIDLGENIYLHDMTALTVRFRGEIEPKEVLSRYIDEYDLGDFFEEMETFFKYDF